LLNAVFFGTPEVAVPFLEKLNGLTRVAAVVTAPDAPSGRGYEIRPPAVKTAAQRLGLPVLQPDSLKEFSLDGLGPLDFGLVVAYGRIIPPAVFDCPKRGLVNVHFSLLPKFRGAAPVQWALIRGEKETGVTLFRIEKGLDTGPVHLQKAAAVRPEDDVSTLRGRLAALGLELLEELVRGIEGGSFETRPQTGEPSLAPSLKKEDGRIRWAEQSAEEVSRRARGTSEWPGAFGTFRGRTVKIRRAEAREGSGVPGAASAEKGEGLLIQCRSGRLLVRRLQPEGKKEMSGEEFWNGARPAAGEKFE
jgi:methionyl-tRNA formyltransferase